jgi:hypothetical protein
LGWWCRDEDEAGVYAAVGLAAKEGSAGCYGVILSMWLGGSRRWGIMEELTPPKKRNSTVSPMVALTVLGEKVIVLFCPTRTCMFLQWTKGRI